MSRPDTHEAPTPDRPAFDAVILAGGRSSRLGGEPKALLRVDGVSLLARTVRAVRAAGAGHIAVVGPREYLSAAGLTGTAALTAVRENPPFSGPAAAIGAGIDALSGEGETGASWTLLLACDMPEVDGAVQVLLDAAGTLPPERSEPPRPGVGAGGGLAGGTGPGGTASLAPEGADAAALPALLAAEGGRAQPLVALHPTGVLRAAVRDRRAAGGLAGLSVFKLLARVHWKEVPVPAGSTADVDTWEDARRAGAQPGTAVPAAGAPEPSWRSRNGKPGGTA